MLTIRKPILTLVFALVALSSLAQRIKYKDVYPMLEVKNYDAAIPMLRQFLSDDKNDDHANAHLQMGMYYEGKVANYHLIEDSTAIISAADSALFYFEKASKLIDDKELRKNDEYYQMYYRRDLRTGDFGIKLSDVQLDVENKIKATRAIVENAGEVYQTLFTINKNYGFCHDAYASFVSRYRTKKNFYIRCNQDQLDTLELIISKMSFIESDFKKVRDAVSLTGVKGYSPELEFMPIYEFGIDGVSEVNFFANDVKAWDFGNWADESLKDIERNVLTMKKAVVHFEHKLKAEHEQLEGLATLTPDQLTLSIDNELLASMHEHDTEPLPEKLFNIWINRNIYTYLTKPLQNPRVEDESNVDYQLMLTDSIMSILDKIEKDASTLKEPYITEGRHKYPALVDGEYGGDFGLIKLRQQMESFVDQGRVKWEEKNDLFKERSKWGVSPDGADSLYLAASVDSLSAPRYLSDYYVLATMRDDSANIYAVGLDFKNGDKGFLAMIDKGRIIQWKKEFNLNGFKYDKSNLLVFGEFIPAQEGNVAAYMFSLADASTSSMIAVSYDKNGTKNWVNPMDAPRKPVSVKLNDIVKETIFYFITEEELETYVGDDPPYKVIDRTGNVR
ncbi:hypothetical protein [Reichenbachiella ulvae]|uniref:Uncharacterized protein n=1 Tax=Reichenbachiella ulvae TaxID=2980104 RepID=A0ABT3CUI4_9BACT|nr:hypothetical protein [Reichenbachiella ulvae]MCV9387218.1 hypothetical protein [Reichenbachiella ulvae]